MRVAFISRATLFTDQGGDTVQMTNTARHLKNIGIDVDIRLADEVIRYTDYDLLHFFNIIRPADILPHIYRSAKPYVVSTIYVDYSEYEKTERKGIPGFLFRTLSAGGIEYFKVIARAVVNGEKIGSPDYIWYGHKRSVQNIIAGCALLLPNSHSEYRRLSRDFSVDHLYRPIPNAIDTELFVRGETLKKQNDLILCVGRLEGRKNQLNLIRAVKDSPFQLILIGAPARNQAGYAAQCRTEAGSNVRFIEHLPQQELLAYYRKAKLHVLPSWFETTGLSSLEAAAMGCNIVVTEKGDTKEYFEDLAWYCSPSSTQSIREAIEKAAAAEVNPLLEERVRREYNWQVTAKKTGEAYQEALSRYEYEDRHYRNKRHT